MSESADTTTAVDSTADSATTDPEPQEQSAPETEPTPNSEAARYRIERNDARTERDALAERVAAYQRRECEAALADILDVPGDLFDIGQAEIASFYGDDGALNEAELLAAARALVEQRPRLGSTKGSRQWGQHGSIPRSGGNGVSWSDIIGPRR